MTIARRHTAPTKSPNKHKTFNIIIPAAGKGVRMMSYGVKSLIKIKNETLINRQLRLIRETFRSYQVILVTGFQSDKLMNETPNNIIKIENIQYEENNVISSIGMGLRAATTNNIVIIYGDLVFNKNIIDLPFDNDSVAIVCNTMGGEEIGCINNNGYIEHFCYELEDKWAQIVYLTGKELMLMQKIAWDKSKYNLFGFEALNWILDKGGRIKVLKPKNGRVMDIDTSKDITKACKLL